MNYYDFYKENGFQKTCEHFKKVDFEFKEKLPLFSFMFGEEFEVDDNKFVEIFKFSSISMKYDFLEKQVNRLRC